MLFRSSDLLSTDIPDNVYQGLLQSKATDIHVFGRRGPAQVKFSPLELREACHVNDVDAIVYDEDFQYDEGSQEAIDSNNQIRVMVNTLEGLRGVEPKGAARRLHLHFFSAPKEIIGSDGKVSGIKIERTKLDGKGGVVPTGEIREFQVQAVYRAVGYFGSELVDVPFDHKYGVIRNAAGRVIDSSGEHIRGMYATGWIKRGPVGLIGHTKSDAMETIACVLADRATWWSPEMPEEAAVVDLLRSKEVAFMGWPEWLKVDQLEKDKGTAAGRERIKLVERQDFLDAAFKKS